MNDEEIDLAIRSTLYFVVALLGGNDPWPSSTATCSAVMRQSMCPKNAHAETHDKKTRNAYAFATNR